MNNTIKPPFVLALDVGTSSTRALLFDAAGKMVPEVDAQRTHTRTGVHFHASYWPAKLRWLSHNQPELMTEVAQWISFGEYLHRRFLGHSRCSLSMASGTGLLNISTLQWDDELVQELGIRPEQLPALDKSSEGMHGLTSEYAARWPVLHDVPWFSAIGDGAAACVGSGCVDATRWSLTIGTSSAVRVVIEPGYVVPPPGLWFYFIDAKRAILGGALSEGGNLLNWLCTNLQLPSLKEAEPLAAALAPDSHALTILPFISGERSLGWHSEARLTITGISRDSLPAAIL